ncbi:unnamed protein product [Darwinula stevensoni]|uniref:Uncharacterized protein n=1 Tax=Darwinula stevensoni TaxID=69355 RepID=A0A7R8XDD1_9CRUS|nr:unnamed protein product [Darwinula stevensoni]CAG0893382.1 unnamed protein product [Darwinula stevensoni]
MTCGRGGVLHPRLPNVGAPMLVVASQDSNHPMSERIVFHADKQSLCAQDPEFEERVTFDDILEELGGYGRWQRLILWLIVFPACIPCGLHGFSQLFMVQVPPHRCTLPSTIEDKISNHSHSNSLYQAILPRQVNGNPSACHEYDATEKDLLSLTHKTIRSLTPKNVSWERIPCSRGWSYNTSGTDGPISIVDEFDLVCERDYYPALALAVFNSGSFIGVALFGYLSDRCGRRKTFFLCLLVEAVAGLATALVPDFTTFAIARFFVGLTIPAVWQIPFIIALEFVGATERTFVTIMTCTWFTFGLLGLAGLAFAFPYWRDLAYATTVPLLPLFLAYWYVLLAQERFQEESGFRIETKNHSRPGLLDLFKTPNLRKKTLLITFTWYVEHSCTSLVRESDSLRRIELLWTCNGKQCVRRIHLVFSCGTGFLPSNLPCNGENRTQVTNGNADDSGRYERHLYRFDATRQVSLGGKNGKPFVIKTKLKPCQQKDNHEVNLFLIKKMHRGGRANSGILSITASFLIIYPFAGELYPTELRSIGLALGSYISNLGLIAVPFIVYLGVENLVLPLIVMGVISTVGGVFSLLLPETLNKPLPQTLEEAEEFGKGWGWRSVLRGEKKLKVLPVSSTQSTELDIF